MSLCSVYQNLQKKFFRCYFLSAFPNSIRIAAVSILHVIYNQWLVQCLVHHRCAIYICWMNEWWELLLKFWVFVIYLQLHILPTYAKLKYTSISRGKFTPRNSLLYSANVQFLVSFKNIIKMEDKAWNCQGVCLRNTIKEFIDYKIPVYLVKWDIVPLQRLHLPQIIYSISYRKEFL